MYHKTQVHVCILNLKDCFERFSNIYCCIPSENQVWKGALFYLKNGGL